MGDNFDLLGDPIPDGFGKRGRPQHLPDEKKRCKVRLLLAIGRLDSEIAQALGISQPTLRKHYFRELKSRVDARFQLEATNLLRLYEQVEVGNVAAIKEMRKVVEHAAIADGHFARKVADLGKPKKEQKLGKKDQSRQDASSPDLSTPLGRAMARRNPDTETIN